MLSDVGHEVVDVTPASEPEPEPEPKPEPEPEAEPEGGADSEQGAALTAATTPDPVAARTEEVLQRVRTVMVQTFERVIMPTVQADGAAQIRNFEFAGADQR